MPELDNTAAQATETTQTAAAPTESQPVATPSPTSTPAPTTAASTKEDYSYVPAKFLKDGKPDFKTLVSSYSSIEKLVSSGKRGAFAPPSADEYEFTPTADIPYDEEMTAAFKQEAHKAGLSKDQYKWLMGQYERLVTQGQSSPEAVEAQLKEEWGSDYPRMLTNANRAWQVYGPSDVNLADYPELANNPIVAKLLARIGGELSEDTSLPAGDSGGVSAKDVEKMMAEPDYWSNPEKQRRVTTWFSKNSK
jgi:hypothetical protein